MTLPPLSGHTIGITADRRWEEQAELLRRRGAAILHGPTIATHYLASDLLLREATERVMSDPPAYLVATTGIGIRAWFETAQAWGVSDRLVAALAGTQVVVRGPKAAGAVASAGLTVWRRAISETLGEVLDILLAEDLAGRRVTVQEYGEQSPELIAALRSAHAEVDTVPVYSWALPDDCRPALDLIRATIGGRVAAVTFTSAPAVRNLVAIAGDAGMGKDLLRAFNQAGVLAACIGPVCTEAARKVGVAQAIGPNVGRLGLLVRLLSDDLERRRQVLRLAGVEVVRQGSSVVIDGDVIALAPQESALFGVLAERPGVIVGRSTLLKRIWGSAGVDPHLLQACVTRLRRRLGQAGDGVVSVHNRGYGLAVSRDYGCDREGGAPSSSTITSS